MLQRNFGDAGGRAASQFMAGLTSGLSGSSGAFAGVSAGAAVAVGGVAAIGAASVVAAEQLYQLGARFDAVSDNMAFRTGKLGADLDALNQSMLSVASTTASSFEDIGDILGQVSVGLGLAGKPLEDLTQDIANFNRQSGETVNIRQLSQLIAVYGQNSTNAAADLNNLYGATQQVLIPFDQLLQSVVRAGPAAQTLGLNVNEVTGLMVLFEKAGVDSGRTYMALTQAAKQFADHNIDLKTGLGDTITQIQTLLNLHTQAGDRQAVDLAGKVFGERNAQAWVNAIREGKLTLDSLQAGLDNTGTSLDEVTEKTKDWAEQWVILKNRIEDALKPIADTAFTGINTFLDYMTGGRGAPWPTSTPPASSQVSPGPQQPIPGLFGVPPDMTGSALPPGPLPGMGADVSVPGGAQPPVVVTPSPAQPPGPPPQDIAGQLATPGAGAGAGAANVVLPLGAVPTLDPGETERHWQAEIAVWNARHNLEEARAQQQQVEADNNSTQSDINQARNDVIQADLRNQQAEIALNEASKQTLRDVQLPYPAGYGAPPRPGETAQQYSAEQSYYEAVHKRQTAEAQLQQLQNTGTATAEDLTAANNELIKARTAEYQAQLRLSDASNKMSDSLDEIGAKLDPDFGISKGLAGIAENLTKFLANLAFAPALGALSAVSAASPSQGGYGLTGILAAQGAFGPQFTGIDYSKYASPSSMAALGPAALQPAAAATARQPYGLPAGTDIRQGAAGFPDWVYQLGQQFGLTASTYPRHQETGGAAGIIKSGPVAPNPAGQNRGIDWWGSPENLATFAQYLQSTGSAEQVIYQNPQTGQQFGYPSGVDYSGDFGKHTDHLHSRFSQSPGAMGVRQQSISSGLRGIAPNATRDEVISGLIMRARQEGLTEPEIAGVLALAQAESNFDRIGFLGFSKQTVDTGYSGGAPYANNFNSAMDQFFKNYKQGGLAAAGGPKVLGSALAGLKTGDSAPFLHWLQYGLQGAVPGQGGMNYEFGPNLTQFYQQWSGLLPGMASGGKIGGSGRGDVVPLWGEPGEFMVNRQAADKWGPWLAWINAHGYQSGGEIDPDQHQGSGAQPGPTQIGGLAPSSGIGPGGVGITPGGSLDTAIGVAASGLDVLAPGAGQAAQVAIKLASRAIQYGGQVAGIAAQGWMETLLPTGGSELAQHNWVTRIVGGLAGARPTLPNLAGKMPSPEQVANVDPNTPIHGTGQGQPPGPTNITVYNQRATEDGTGRDIAYHQQQRNAAPGM